jgi:hypothetical protein
MALWFAQTLQSHEVELPGVTAKPIPELVG